MLEFYNSLSHGDEVRIKYQGIGGINIVRLRVTSKHRLVGKGKRVGRTILTPLAEDGTLLKQRVRFTLYCRPNRALESASHGKEGLPLTEVSLAVGDMATQILEVEKLRKTDEVVEDILHVLKPVTFEDFLFGGKK